MGHSIIYEGGWLTIIGHGGKAEKWFKTRPPHIYLSPDPSIGEALRGTAYTFTGTHYESSPLTPVLTHRKLDGLGEAYSHIDVRTRVLLLHNIYLRPPISPVIGYVAGGESYVVDMEGCEAVDTLRGRSIDIVYTPRPSHVKDYEAVDGHIRLGGRRFAPLISLDDIAKNLGGIFSLPNPWRCSEGLVIQLMRRLGIPYTEHAPQILRGVWTGGWVAPVLSHLTSILMTLVRYSQLPPQRLQEYGVGTVAQHVLATRLMTSGIYPETAYVGETGIHGRKTYLPEAGRFRDVHVYDFSQLYPTYLVNHPHDVIFSRPSPDGSVEGRYGEHTRLVEELMHHREAMRGRAGELALKVLINSLSYGAVAGGVGILNPVMARDIFNGTARMMSSLIQHLESRGHRVVYSDTDSLFIQPSHPQTLGRDIEESLSTIGWGGGRLRYEGRYSEAVIPKAKHYILISRDGVVVKGLSISSLPLALIDHVEELTQEYLGGGGEAVMRRALEILGSHDPILMYALHSPHTDAEPVRIYPALSEAEPQKTWNTTFHSLDAKPETAVPYLQPHREAYLLPYREDMDVIVIPEGSGGGAWLTHRLVPASERIIHATRHLERTLLHMLRQYGVPNPTEPVETESEAGG